MLSFEKAVASAGIIVMFCKATGQLDHSRLFLPPFKDPPTVMFDHS